MERIQEKAPQRVHVPLSTNCWNSFASGPLTGLPIGLIQQQAGHWTDGFGLIQHG